MNNAEYFKRLEHHDWFFAMSDDHEVWRKGQAVEDSLRSWSSTDAEKKRMWDAWCEWRNALLGGQKAARPQLNQFIEQAA